MQLCRGLIRSILVASVVASAPARAQPALEPQAGYVESVETPGETGGEFGEADAADGQAEEGGSRLSRRAARRVEEIVVRARKRDELLEETPISITALSQATLREAGITSVDQIQDLVPNLTFVTGRTGLDNRVRIRGVGPLEGGDPGVGIYVDGVYLPRALGSLLNIIDIQQLEVLRGPQGTLFGKNTVGGAINITTIKPHEEVEGFAFVRAASFETVETRAVLNLPILDDRLYSRFSFASANSRGYVYDEFRDDYWTDQNALWALGSLRYLPLDDIEVNVSGNWYRGNSKGKGGQCFAELDRAPNNIVQSLIIEPNYPDYFEVCARTEPFRQSADAAPIASQTDYGVWGNVTWDLGALGGIDELTLKLLGSWRDQTSRLREDIDQTRIPLVLVSALSLDEPFAGRARESQSHSLEGQANAVALDGRLVMVTGVFAQWEDRSIGLATRGAEGTAADLSGGTTLESTVQKDWDWAIFGQGTWDFLDWASLTAGIRYTQEKKGVDRLTINPFATGEGQVLLDADGSALFDAWTPMASLQMSAPEDWLDDVPVEHLMGYFTYARGFKGGGFNATASSSRQVAQDLEPYKPEFLDSFEIGFKTIALDEKLTLNASFFLSDYTDIQVVTTQALPGADPDDLPVVERTITNAAKATLKGIELEAFSRPIDGLEINGSIGLLDAIYDQYIGISDIDGTQLDRSGQTFSDVPEFTSFVAAQYSFEVGVPGPDWIQGWLTPRLEWYYQSRTHINVGPELRGANQSGYNLLHFRTSYDFLDDRAQVAFFIRNLTDQEYFREVQTIVNPFGTLTRYFDPPRTFGGEISYAF